MPAQITKLVGKIPIRVILVVPFIILILVTVGLIGYLWFNNGQQAVNNVTFQLLDKSSTRINQHVLTYMDTPHLFHQVNAAAVESGELDLDDFSKLEEYFWYQTNIRDAASYVYWGNEAGEFIGVQRLLDGEKLVKIRNQATAPIREIYGLDDNGQRTGLVSSSEYDPRVRPWYEIAAETGEPTWSPIYTSASIRNLIITPVAPFYDESGTLLGVLAIDLSLAQISEFLQSIEISQSGQAYIMERTGEIVASSTDELPYVEVGDTEERLHTLNSQQPLIRATTQYLLQEFGNLNQINSKQQFAFEMDGNRQLGEITPLSDGRGLDWLIVVVIPEDDFMGQINTATQSTIWLSLVALLIALGVGLLTAHWVVQPILQLNTAAKNLAQGQWEQRVPIEREDEVGELANSFDSMAEQLQESFLTLEASEEKYRNLFEDSKDAIFVTSPTGEILDMNPAALNLFGYTRAEVETINMQMLYADPEDRLQYQEIIEEQGMVRDFEIRYRKKDGTVLDCLETATVRYAADGTVLNYHGIIRDISGQKRAEKERLQLSALQRELVIARDIQQSLLLPPRPDWPSLDVTCYSQPAREVGGDFYAYYALESQNGHGPASPHPSFALAVGDVSGKGIPAALLMAVSLASFQSTIGRDFGPSQLLAYLNENIILYTGSTKQNCAFVYVELSPIPTQSANPGLTADRTACRLRVANAGCIVPLIRRGDGTVEWVEVFGLPLGVRLSAESGYLEADVQLSPGDLVIMTSDGIVEAQNELREMFGFTRLEEAVSAGPTTSAEAMLNHLRAEIDAFLDVEPHDDLTIVVARI